MMAGFVAAEARVETGSGEGSRWSEPPIDSAVGSGVRSGGHRGGARHKRGNRKRYRQAWTVAQEAKLREAVSEERFRTVGEAVRWCEKVLRVEVLEGKGCY